MILVFELLAAALLLFLVGAAATGRLAGLVEATPDRADVSLPPGRLHPDDANEARFTLAFRGYRMDEVDAAVDRLVEELRVRDAELADKDTELAKAADELAAVRLAATPATPQPVTAQEPPPPPQVWTHSSAPLEGPPTDASEA